eukprot:TRINITY_DN3225_c0_g1_i1.p1 TRINITY_DN3225_c0_g1~~TRINITY_DN3225_c0_g1_i1.p1  ORF type:complete len:542 (+),score=135.38 TRINITY_DN3225_c0_g1_i1:107-1627(+)
MELYMACRCQSWDQWATELRNIQAASRSGNPTAQHGRQLQVLEAFIQSIFQETLLLPSGTSRWPNDSLDRAVARALHLAICQTGDHAGYGVTCAYCAALLRCATSEQALRTSLAQLPWSPATHPRYPMPFRAVARAVGLSIGRAHPKVLSDGLLVHILEFVPPIDVPGVKEPFDGPFNAMGCLRRFHPGPRRCMGYYRCACDATWHSAHTWAGRGQGCIACGQNVEPAHCDPLWLRSAVVDIPANYPTCVVIASSPIAMALSYPFIPEEGDLDAFHRFTPKPRTGHLHGELELEAQLVYRTGAEAAEARAAYEAEYYLCGSDTSFLLPCLESASALRLARVPEAVPEETLVRDFGYLARLGAEECVPTVRFVPYGASGYRTAVITFPDPAVASEVFFQYHCQLDETTELADCGVCQDLGFSCTLQLQLHGGDTPAQLVLRGIPPYMPVEEILEVFAALGHPDVDIARHPTIHRLATVTFGSVEAAHAAHTAFYQLIAERVGSRGSA